METRDGGRDFADALEKLDLEAAVRGLDYGKDFRDATAELDREFPDTDGCFGGGFGECSGKDFRDAMAELDGEFPGAEDESVRACMEKRLRERQTAADIKYYLLTRGIFLAAAAVFFLAAAKFSPLLLLTLLLFTLAVNENL
jgi:hypothetical protein